MGASNKEGGFHATDQMKSGANSTDDGGTGIKGSADGKGATDKSTEDPRAPTGSKTGMSSGNAWRYWRRNNSTEGLGATDKN